MLRSWSDPVVNAASFGLQHAKAESCVRRGVSCGGWAVILPWRGPFHGKGESLPVRVPWSSPRCFLREARSTQRKNRAWIPRRGRTVRGSRADEEPWPRPADPPEPRPHAPVEALSENDPTPSHSDAAARSDPPQRRSTTRSPPAATQQRRSADRHHRRTGGPQSTRYPSPRTVVTSSAPSFRRRYPT